MGLKRLLLRYHPPGITLEYTRKTVLKTKDIDLLELGHNDDPETVANKIIQNEPLLSNSKSYDIIKGANLIKNFVFLLIFNQKFLIFVQNVKLKFHLLKLISILDENLIFVAHIPKFLISTKISNFNQNF